MDGQNLRFGEWEVRYFPADAPLSFRPAGSFGEPEDRFLARHERMRRVLLLLPRWRQAAYYLLHWSDGSDLSVLDELITTGQGDPAYFSGAVVGEMRGITCLECHGILRVVVYENVVTSLLFGDDAVRRSRTHSFERSCRVCQSPWTVSALEFCDVPPSP
ncbi:hypothetical protein GCM10010420_52680 [Streptomyces glaucosporus]|uniref:Uncharacterized protein n=1 Tax=Streptomyces glaucosporus TaxID=284044 RepID=A0ABP5W3U3_9ACTN